MTWADEFGYRDSNTWVQGDKRSNYIFPSMPCLYSKSKYAKNLNRINYSQLLHKNKEQNIFSDKFNIIFFVWTLKAWDD